VRYAESFDRKFIPYELARGMETTRKAFGAIAPGESVAIMIGPEGGFDEQEVALAGEAGVLPITLGGADSAHRNSGDDGAVNFDVSSGGEREPSQRE